MTARKSRPKRILAWAGAVLGAVLVVLVVGTLIWSQTGVMTAESAPLAAAEADTAVEIIDESSALVLRPAGAEASRVGLLFVPGAKVEAEAYVARLAGVVADAGVTVVITRPWLNLALLDLRGLDSFTSLAPDIEVWMVGGHSLGGVRACSMVDDADALVLFASYCAADVADARIPVLSIAGSEDGLSTPTKIADAAHLLPADAQFVEIPGANHASFGDYGVQSGDGTATISDAEMTGDVTRLLTELVDQLR